MKIALLGALVVIAGIAALVIASAHAPYLEVASNTGAFNGPPNGFDTTLVWDWPRTTYEAVRIGGWAIVIFGTVIVAVALIREFRRPATA